MYSLRFHHFLGPGICSNGRIWLEEAAECGQETAVASRREDCLRVIPNVNPDKQKEKVDRNEGSIDGSITRS